MTLRSVATSRTASVGTTPSLVGAQRAVAEVLANLVIALAMGSVLLLLVSGALAGTRFLPGSPGAVPAFESWSLIRTAASVQIGITVLATGLAALAKAGGAAGARAERWCVVAASSAAAGTLLLIVPPV